MGAAPGTAACAFGHAASARRPRAGAKTGTLALLQGGHANFAQPSFKPDFSGFSLLDTRGSCQYKTATFRQAVSFSNPGQDASKRSDPKKLKRCL